MVSNVGLRSLVVVLLAIVLGGPIETGSAQVPEGAGWWEALTAPRTAPGSYLPVALAADPMGNIYEVDASTHQIVKLGPDGKELARWSRFGTSIAVGRHGTVYLTDAHEPRIWRLSPRGLVLGSWRTQSQPAPHSRPIGTTSPQRQVTTDRQGNVVLLQEVPIRPSAGGAWCYCAVEIRIFSPAGRVLGHWMWPALYQTSYSSRPMGPFTEMNPAGIAVDAQGNIYLAGNVYAYPGDCTHCDYSLSFLEERSRRGSLLGVWDKAPVSDIVGLAIDTRRDVLIATSEGVTVLSHGGFRVWRPHPCGISAFAEPSAVTTDARGAIYLGNGADHNLVKLSASGDILAVWGGCGRDFSESEGVAVDGQGAIYVADSGNNRVVKMSPAGQLLAVWGQFGNDPTEFHHPRGVAVDATGDIYVADGDDRIVKLSPEGKLMTAWGAHGSGPGQFYGPAAIAVDLHGNVYVVDFDNRRVEEFTSDGTFLRQDTVNDPSSSSPISIAVDHQGNVYVGDSTFGSSIVKLSPAGDVLARWTWPARDSSSLTMPAGLAVDASGNVFISDPASSQIVKLSPAGDLLSRWLTPGPALGRFQGLRGAAVDAQGTVYLCDYGRILKLSLAK